MTDELYQDAEETIMHVWLRVYEVVGFVVLAISEERMRVSARVEFQHLYVHGAQSGVHR